MNVGSLLAAWFCHVLSTKRPLKSLVEAQATGYIIVSLSCLLMPYTWDSSMLGPTQIGTWKHGLGNLHFRMVVATAVVDILMSNLSQHEFASILLVKICQNPDLVSFGWFYS